MAKEKIIIENTSPNRVYLRAVEPEDYLTSYRWRSDFEALQYETHRYVSKETERKWVLKIIEEHETGKSVRLAICLKENNQLIGYIHLSDIDYQNRSCEIHTLIGSKEHQGGGFGTEARIMILRYAFLELGMERVRSRIIANNAGSIKSGIKSGYTYEGTLRKAVFQDGQFFDVLLFSILKEEFLQKFNG